MPASETSTNSTDLRTLPNVDSSNVSNDTVSQSGTSIQAVCMNSTEQLLVSRNSMDDHYDTIGSLRGDNERHIVPMSGTLTNEDNSSGQSMVPYMMVSHLQPSVAPPLAPGTRQCCPWKRCLLVGLVVTVIITLLSALVAVTTVLLTYQSEQKGGDVTLATSQSTFPASTTMNISTISTTVAATTTPLSSSTMIVAATTTPLSSSTMIVAATTTTLSSSTTATSPGCSRKCISCTSYNTRCPANGAIVEGDPGEVIPCPCDTACYSDVRYDDGSSVHRGCTKDFPAWDAESSVDLTCRQIGRHFLCFCLGDRCNKDDMTSHIL